MSRIRANIRGEPYELIYIMIARAAGCSTLPLHPPRVRLSRVLHTAAFKSLSVNEKERGEGGGRFSYLTVASLSLSNRSAAPRLILTRLLHRAWIRAPSIARFFVQRYMVVVLLCSISNSLSPRWIENGGREGGRKEGRRDPSRIFFLG